MALAGFFSRKPLLSGWRGPSHAAADVPWVGSWRDSPRPLVLTLDKSYSRKISFFHFILLSVKKIISNWFSKLNSLSFFSYVKDWKEKAHKSPFCR